MIRFGLILLTISVIAGCAGPGRLYTNVVEPFTTNFHDTPVGIKKCVLQDHTIQVNNVSAEWVTEYFADALKENGIKEFYYADMRTFSVLFGLYRRKTLIIYGD